MPNGSTRNPSWVMSFPDLGTLFNDWACLWFERGQHDADIRDITFRSYRSDLTHPRVALGNARIQDVTESWN